MLKLQIPKVYQVKKRQTLEQIARAFCVSAFLLAKENELKSEPKEGDILRVPSERGNAYFVQENESKALLCGGEENFKRKNGTDCFYIGMRVIL